MTAVMERREIHVPSRSEPGVYYTVLIGIDGEVSCNCGGYEHRQDCWHVRYVKEEGMTTALTTIKVQPPSAALPTSDEMKSMDMVAAHLIESKAVAIPTNLKTKEDVRAVIFAGWEFGVKPMTALRHIGVINGKTEPDAQLMAGIILAKESDARFVVSKETPDSTTVRFTRPSKGIDVEYTVTMDDAKRAGLAGKPGPWTQYPRDMRRWHAVKRLCRTYAPDLINGIASATYGDLPLPVDPMPEVEYIDAPSSVVVDDDLLSEGDIDPVEEEPLTEPEMVSAAQKRRLTDLLQDAAHTWDKETLGTLYAGLRRDYPHAFNANMNKLTALTAQQAAAIIDRIDPQPPERDEEDDSDADAETPQGGLFEEQAARGD